MDVLTLSRLQFAATACFHFLFVPLTLGLSILVAIMETRFVKTGDALYLRMTKFWGKLFLINFALGVVTGITLEFQFGMNWAAFSKYVGDIFGAPLAIEATLAFFLESTFIGLWIFGWDKLSARAHAATIWVVAIASNLSAVWILLANGWMQRPVGFVLRNGRAEMVDFGALVSNIYSWAKFLHTTSSAYLLGAFFVMAVSAWHIARRSELEFFKRSFKMAAAFGLHAAVLTLASGAFSAIIVAKFQPTKLAAMEGVWTTRKAAPYYLLAWPDPSRERNSFQAWGVPRGLSLLAHHDPDSEVTGLKDFPRDMRPPVMATFLSFKGMVLLGMLLTLVAFLAWLVSRKDLLESNPALLRVALYCLPLPYLAIQLGWIVSEVGRQPWIVYGLLKTSDGVSKSLSTGQVLASLAGFTLYYGTLAAVDFYLLYKNARQGPSPAPQGA